MNVYPRCVVCRREPRPGDVWHWIGDGLLQRVRGVCSLHWERWEMPVTLPDIADLPADDPADAPTRTTRTR